MQNHQLKFFTLSDIYPYKTELFKRHIHFVIHVRINKMTQNYGQTFTNTKYIVEITYSLPGLLRHAQLSEGCRSMWDITSNSTTPLQSGDTF
jgi:hypothetical protein